MVELIYGYHQVHTKRTNFVASGPVISTCRSTATSHKIVSLTKFQKFCSGDPKSRGMYM